ncbi:unnamed protein product [Calicophoron daubneyi]|uniref:C2H2-type domain-containing protein n=1 Tax=Calicophoron daubneyi TaxID=300641 RepID=A0AAV2TMA9_CALDB
MMTSQTRLATNHNCFVLPSLINTNNEHHHRPQDLVFSDTNNVSCFGTSGSQNSSTNVIPGMQELFSKLSTKPHPSPILAATLNRCSGKIDNYLNDLNMGKNVHGSVSTPRSLLSDSVQMECHENLDSSFETSSSSAIDLTDFPSSLMTTTFSDFSSLSCCPQNSNTSSPSNLQATSSTPNFGHSTDDEHIAIDGSCSLPLDDDDGETDIVPSELIQFVSESARRVAAGGEVAEMDVSVVDDSDIEDLDHESQLASLCLPILQPPSLISSSQVSENLRPPSLSPASPSVGGAFTFESPTSQFTDSAGYNRHCFDGSQLDFGHPLSHVDSAPSSSVTDEEMVSCSVATLSPCKSLPPLVNFISSGTTVSSARANTILSPDTEVCDGPNTVEDTQQSPYGFSSSSFPSPAVDQRINSILVDFHDRTRNSSSSRVIVDSEPFVTTSEALSPYPQQSVESETGAIDYFHSAVVMSECGYSTSLPRQDVPVHSSVRRGSPEKNTQLRLSCTSSPSNFNSVYMSDKQQTNQPVLSLSCTATQPSNYVGSCAGTPVYVHPTELQRSQSDANKLENGFCGSQHVRQIPPNFTDDSRNPDGTIAYHPKCTLPIDNHTTPTLLCGASTGTTTLRELILSPDSKCRLLTAPVLVCPRSEGSNSQISSSINTAPSSAHLKQEIDFSMLNGQSTFLLAPSKPQSSQVSNIAPTILSSTFARQLGSANPPVSLVPLRNKTFTQANSSSLQSTNTGATTITLPLNVLNSLPNLRPGMSIILSTKNCSDSRANNGIPVSSSPVANGIGLNSTCNRSNSTVLLISGSGLAINHLDSRSSSATLPLTQLYQQQQQQSPGLGVLPPSTLPTSFLVVPTLPASVQCRANVVTTVNSMATGDTRVSTVCSSNPVPMATHFLFLRPAQKPTAKPNAGIPPTFGSLSSSATGMTILLASPSQKLQADSSNIVFVPTVASSSAAESQSSTFQAPAHAANLPLNAPAAIINASSWIPLCTRSGANPCVVNGAADLHCLNLGVNHAGRLLANSNVSPTASRPSADILSSHTLPVPLALLPNASQQTVLLTSWPPPVSAANDLTQTHTNYSSNQAFLSPLSTLSSSLSSSSGLSLEPASLPSPPVLVSYSSDVSQQTISSAQSTLLPLLVPVTSGASGVPTPVPSSQSSGSVIKSEQKRPIVLPSAENLLSTRIPTIHPTSNQNIRGSNKPLDPKYRRLAASSQSLALPSTSSADSESIPSLVQTAVTTTSSSGSSSNSSSNRRRHQCPYCPKSCERKDNLQAHIRTHTGERPYPCRFCPKAFPQKDHLRAHIRTHTGEKPYRCPQCLKAFAQLGNLHRHVKTHRR